MTDESLPENVITFVDSSHKLTTDCPRIEGRLSDFIDMLCTSTRRYNYFVIARHGDGVYLQLSQR